MWPSNQPNLLDKAEIDRLNKRFAEQDRAAGIELTDKFTPFHQRNDIFTRAFWDDRVKSPNTEGFFASYREDFASRKGAGFSQKDFALRNAAWSVSDMVSNRSADQGTREGFQAPIIVDTPIAKAAVPVDNPERESAE